MTVLQAITEIKKDKPNTFDDVKLIKWLEDLDRRVNIELLEPYGINKDMPDYTKESVLLVPDAYRRIYLYWLSAMIDYAYGEIDKYNNDYIMFNAEWSSYASYVLTHYTTKNLKIRY